MRKTSILLLSLIGCFSIIGLSPIVTASAQRPTPNLNVMALWARGLTLSHEMETPNYYAFAVIQNNIAFAWATFLQSPSPIALGNAWYCLLGISKFVETWGSPFYFLSVANLKSVGSIFPGVLEVYNDSIIPNGVCDTHLFGVGANKTEVLYYLHLVQYAEKNLSKLDPAPTNFFNYEVNPDYSDITYTWGISYVNVVVNIMDALNWTSWSQINTATFDYINISYELDFDSDGSYELRQNFNFGNISEPTPGFWDGLSLSVLQFNFAQTLSFDLSVNTQARNETGQIVSDPNNSTIFRTAKLYVGYSDLMTLDLATTKENYTLGGTENYTVSATSVPWYTGVYNGHIVDGTYDHNLKWHRTVTAFQYRLCYNQWNGSRIDHDPIFGMASPIPLLVGFTVHENGWVPTAIIGGIIAGVAMIILISAVVIHRRSK
ncbi:MAG: hypothetical protein ACTSO9_16025 [Candidatus Helarchaeota archaeon]